MQKNKKCFFHISFDITEISHESITAKIAAVDFNQIGRIFMIFHDSAHFNSNIFSLDRPNMNFGFLKHFFFLSEPKEDLYVMYTTKYFIHVPFYRSFSARNYIHKISLLIESESLCIKIGRK